MKILFVGGGSLGPVTPLVATAHALKKQHPAVSFVWVGTPMGPEKEMVAAAGIPFFSLSVAKWPRYPSVDWLLFPWRWVQARLQARKLVRTLRPQAVVTVGGFTAVPIVQAAAAVGIPCFTHQLDREPGLANRLIASYCQSVTTSFQYAKRPFGDEVEDEPLATPVRYQLTELPSREQAVQSFGLNPHQSVVLVYGGGQGAQAFNQLLERTLSEWLRFTQIIHVTGNGKAMHLQGQPRKGYVVRSLLQAEEMLLAHTCADLEIIRGGIGSLSEVAALKKAALVIPMPDSHQEANARAFEECGAVTLFDQTTASFDHEVLASAKLLLQDRGERAAMGERAHVFFATDDGHAFAERILNRLTKTV